MKKIQSLCFISAALLLGCCNHAGNSVKELPYYNTADFTPLWPGEHPVNIDTLHTIAPFSFTDQNGQVITDDDYAGKIYVANFFYSTCPGICPRMQGNLRTVADTFKTNPDIMFLSFSVMPNVDSVERLRSYAGYFKINDKQWHLLTGNRKMIYNLARQSYFAEAEPGLSKDSTIFLHTEHLILVDKNRHIRGVYNGTLQLDMDRLIGDIRILLAGK